MYVTYTLYVSLKEAVMTNHRRFDLSVLAIAALLIVQSSLASYGASLLRDIVGRTHASLVAVARAER
jgi:hypothetical protein